MVTILDRLLLLPRKTSPILLGMSFDLSHDLSRDYASSRLEERLQQNMRDKNMT